jgi:phosphotransferase system IIB component
MVNSEEAVEEFLEHFGIKGMKWGIRNQPSKKDQKVRNKRQQISVKRRHLEDGDLNAYITRLNSEKKLKELVDNDLSPGKTIAKKIMSDAGQQVARTVVVGLGVYAIRAAIQKKFDPTEAVSYLKPKKK